MDEKKHYTPEEIGKIIKDYEIYQNESLSDDPLIVINSLEHLVKIPYNLKQVLPSLRSERLVLGKLKNTLKNILNQ